MCTSIILLCAYSVCSYGLGSCAYPKTSVGMHTCVCIPNNLSCAHPLYYRVQTPCVHMVSSHVHAWKQVLMHTNHVCIPNNLSCAHPLHYRVHTSCVHMVSSVDAHKPCVHTSCMHMVSGFDTHKPCVHIKYSLCACQIDYCVHIIHLVVCISTTCVCVSNISPAIMCSYRRNHVFIVPS